MQHEVWIPSVHRDLTNGQDTIQIEGETLGEVVENLDAQFPGMADRLCQDGRIRAHISVAVNGETINRGLHQRIKTDGSEIHFVPAVGGGA